MEETSNSRSGTGEVTSEQIFLAKHRGKLSSSQIKELEAIWASNSGDKHPAVTMAQGSSDGGRGVKRQCEEGHAEPNSGGEHSAVTKRMAHASCGDRRQPKRTSQEEQAHMPPRKRMRWKQPAPSGSGQPPANSSRASTGDGHSAVERSISLESSDGAQLAAKLMDFRAAKELHSELLAMLDEPDDAIRFEKPYLPESDFPIWEFVRKFKRVPKEIREDGESNKEENKLAQYIRKHKTELHKETLAVLNHLPGEDTYSWCKGLRSAKQRLEESKQKQLDIDSEDKHCVMPIAKEANSGGRHPALRTTKETISGVPQPAGMELAVPALDAEILSAVRACNGYPKRGKDKTQNLLAKKIAKKMARAAS